MRPRAIRWRSPSAPDRGRISVYAQGADYHDVVKKGLKALARWLVAEAGCELKVFVDTAPVMEKPLAEAAGIGWQGKHTNLVSRSHGSWLFLGAIYTTLDLGDDLPADEPHEVRCGSCTACLDICPTAAFPAPFQLDARRCISYLTIEHKGPIPEEFRQAIGNRIYGCDDCLAVCPWNRFADAARANKAFLPRAETGGAGARRPARGSTMPAFARSSRDRRSSGSGGAGWCATRRSRPAIAACRSWRPRCRRWSAMRMRWSRRRRAGRWTGSARLLPPAERGDAGGAIDVAAVGEAGVDMGDDRLGARARRIEIGVEHADRAEELELARRAFADVEIGIAEQGDEGARILAHHAFEPVDCCRPAAARPAGATGGAGVSAHGRDAAGGESGADRRGE